MEIREYQERAMETCLSSSRNPLYMLFELGEEYGELVGKFSKAIRKGNIRFMNNRLETCLSDDEWREWRELVLKEIGDIMWGIAGICDVFDVKMEDVARINLDKLASRKVRNVIDGAGDNR